MSVSRETAQEWYQGVKGDFEKYLALDPVPLHIKPKAGGIIPFQLNPVQKVIHRAIEKQREERGYVRVLGLKARQQGYSTYVEGRFYWRTTTSTGKTAMIMAHEDKATGNLFAMAKLYHDKAPGPLRPDTKASNAKELIFDNDHGTGLKSQYIVQTAGSSRAGGRSFTIHFLHASEVAHWGQTGAAIFGGAYESVPSEYPAILGTEVVLETTANGLDPVFYPLWQAAKAGENEYLPIFIPWYFHPGYRMPLTDAEANRVEGTLDDYERWLLSRKDSEGYPLDLEHIAWRRNKVATAQPKLGLTKLQWFQQEYPATEREAFVSTGRHVFDVQKLMDLAEQAAPPVSRYDLPTYSSQWTAQADGRLKVWKEPDPMRAYVIGADVAEGLVHGDYSCADVLDHLTGEQVAQWHGHVHPEQFGDLLAALGQRYNHAHVAPERNNHGLTTITRLEQLDYARLYVELVPEHPPARPRKRFGFVSSHKTKPLIIDELVGELNEDTHGIACKETFIEMQGFKQHEDGSLGADEGQWDDRVMSRAIAGYVRRVLPLPRVRVNRASDKAPPPPGAHPAKGRKGWAAHT